MYGKDYSKILTIKVIKSLYGFGFLGYKVNKVCDRKFSEKKRISDFYHVLDYCKLF